MIEKTWSRKYTQATIDGIFTYSWPVFLIVRRMLWRRANNMPAATSLAPVALIAYTGRFPSGQALTGGSNGLHVPCWGRGAQNDVGDSTLVLPAKTINPKMLICDERPHHVVAAMK
jgi:hypothetical protein